MTPPTRPLPKRRAPGAPYVPVYVKRRPLGAAELRVLAGIGLGVGLAVGAATAYLAGLWMAREPLDPALDPTTRRRPRA